jgi:hypothetical protein
VSQGTGSPGPAATATRSSIPAISAGTGQQRQHHLHPRDQSEIVFADCTTGCGPTSPPLSSGPRSTRFIRQDDYLRSHRGEIAERFARSTWYSNIDLRILQDFSVQEHRAAQFQVSLDILNLGNLISSVGVRKVAKRRGDLATARGAGRQQRADVRQWRSILNYGPGGNLHRRSTSSRAGGLVGLRYFFE